VFANKVTKVDQILNNDKWDTLLNVMTDQRFNTLLKNFTELFNYDDLNTKINSLEDKLSKVTRNMSQINDKNISNSQMVEKMDYETANSNLEYGGEKDVDEDIVVKQVGVDFCVNDNHDFVNNNSKSMDN